MADRKTLKAIYSYIPQKIKKEVYKRRRSTPFLISVSFLIAFLTARIWVIYFQADTSVSPDVSYSVGKNLLLGGYHIHHITYGVVLVAISGWLSINYRGKGLARISSIMYGSGLGLIVDEIGFIIGGVEPYKADTEVFYVAVGFIALLAAIVYFPSFYRSIKRDFERLHERYEE